MRKVFLITVLAVFLFLKCSEDYSFKEEDEYTRLEKYQQGEEFSIGKFSVSITSNDAFGRKIPGLDRKGDIDFIVGDRLFNTSWVPGPASTSSLDGLGPTFNAKACANCHFKDGRGSPLSESSAISSKGFLMRLSIVGQDPHGGPKPSPDYGLQLQNRSIFGVPYEAKVKVQFETIKGKYPDGTPYELQKPIYTLYDEQFGSMQNLLTSPRVGNQTIGLGFIDALSEEEILKNADEFDKDNDGISGKANYVWDVIKQEKSIGRFGWKANEPNLLQQIAGAFSGDIGLTTSILPKENCPSPQKDCNDAPNGGNPEITDKQLSRVTFYQASLAVPMRRNVKDKDVLKGKALFHKLKCISCHAVGLKTGKSTINPLIDGVTINPYSDFLLHDMGDELADGRPDFLANGNEWRTQPLWGIGLIKTVNKHTFLLHDGRARNIEEAILWHGGEAKKSKEDFMKLTKKQREQVIKFINTL